MYFPQKYANFCCFKTNYKNSIKPHTIPFPGYKHYSIIYCNSVEVLLQKYLNNIDFWIWTKIWKKKLYSVKLF